MEKAIGITNIMAAFNLHKEKLISNPINNDIKKEFKYKGYTFTITVNLNKKVEKRIGGQRWHEVIVECEEFFGYLDRSLVIDKNLVCNINKSEKIAKGCVDKVENCTDKLLELGFEVGSQLPGNSSEALNSLK